MTASEAAKKLIAEINAEFRQLNPAITCPDDDLIFNKEYRAFVIDKEIQARTA